MSEARADAVDRLADEVDRLTIDRRDPERFFEQRSEIVYRMRQEARILRGERADDRRA